MMHAQAAAVYATEDDLLHDVLSFLYAKNGGGEVIPVSKDPTVSLIATVANKILMSVPHGSFKFLTEALTAGGLATLKRWAGGHLEPNELLHPQYVAAVLLWADTWKAGS